MSVSAPHPDDDLDLDAPPPASSSWYNDHDKREIPTNFSFELNFKLPEYDCCSLLLLKRAMWQVIPPTWRPFIKLTPIPDDDVIQMRILVPNFGNPDTVMELKHHYPRQQIEVLVHHGTLGMVIWGILQDDATKILRQMVESRTALMFP